MVYLLMLCMQALYTAHRANLLSNVLDSSCSKTTLPKAELEVELNPFRQ